MRPLAVDLVLLRSTALDLPLVVGRVLAARVLERHGQHGIINLAGAYLTAELPDELQPGDRLGLVVQDTSGGRVTFALAQEPPPLAEPPVVPRDRLVLQGGDDAGGASHYPAVDVLQSVSRLVGEVVSPEVRAAGQAVRQLLAAYREKEDLIAIGAYQRGTDPLVDAAIALRPAVERCLRQTVDERTSAADADRTLLDIAAGIAEHAAPETVDAEPVASGAAALAERLATPVAAPAIPPLNLRV